MKFNEWLDTFLSEKGINVEDTSFTIDRNKFTHLVELGVLVGFIKDLPISTKKKIKNNLVLIDLRNGDITHFLRYLAELYVKSIGM